MLEGEPGVGKTRFVREALTHIADDRRVLIGHCLSQRKPAPLLSLVDALRNAGPLIDRTALSPVAGAVAVLLPELMHVLPEPPTQPSDAGAAQHQLFRGLLEVLRSLSPLILVLEDLHWADETTTELLQLLVAQGIPDFHLVLTYRREDLDRGSSILSLPSRVPAGVAQLRLELTALDRDGVKTMIEEMLATTVTDDFAMFVYERTGGLPFAVEETLRLLTDRHDLVRLHGSWARHAVDQLEVPLAVQDAVVERISRLTKEGQDVVAAVAVLGGDASTSRVAALVGHSREVFDDALDDATGSAVMREGVGGQLEFRHALAADAAYGSIPLARRARLHQVAAELLLAEGGSSDATLAIHLREAQDPAWVRHAEAATDGPLAFLDPVGTYELLRDIVTSEIAGPEQLRIAAKMSLVALRTPHYLEAAKLAQDVLDGSSGQPNEKADLRLALALLRWVSGDVPAAYASLREVTREAEQGSAASLRAMATLCLPVVESMNLDEHLHWLERAENGLTQATSEVVRAVVQTNAVTCRIAAGLLSVDEAIRALPIGSADTAVQHEEQRGRQNVAELAMYLGHYDDVSELLASMIDEGCTPGLSYWPDREALSIHLDFLTGRWELLARPAARFAAGHLDLSNSHMRILLEFTFATLTSATDATASTLSTMARLAKEASDAGAIPPSLNIHAEHAQQLLDLGRPDDARDVVLTGMALLRRKGVWAWCGSLLPVAAAVLHVTEGSHAAAELASEARAHLVATDAPAAQVALSVATALGCTAETERGRQLEAAARQLQLFPRPLDSARAWEYAAALGDPDRATPCYLEAAELYGTLGASQHLARVNKRLRQAGVATPTRRRTTSGSLTARESEIASLVARGHSNRDIAELLFLSPRTVEHHLERARRKLGAANRGALRQLSDDELSSLVQ
jgi:DNA-binding CsgD family transcriptional regulator